MTAPRSEPNNVYVAEKVGRVRVIVRGRLRARPFLDIRSLVLDSGEQGSLASRSARSTRADRHFYVDYTDRNGDARIVEYKSRGLSRRPRKRAADLLPGRSVSEPQRREPRVRPDGYLYIGNGRRRLRRRSREPGAEPAVDARQAPEVQRRRAKASAAARSSATGCANPWRFSFDRQTGNLLHRRRRPGLLGRSSTTRKRGTPGLENYGWRVLRGQVAVHVEPGAERGRASRVPVHRPAESRRTAR